MKNKKVNCSWCFYLLFIVVFLNSCSQEDLSIGMGVFHFSPDQSSSIKVYESTELKSSLYDVRAQFSDGQGRLYLSSRARDLMDFRPLRYGQLRGFMTLRVIKINGNKLKVIVNEDTLEEGWIYGTEKDVEGWEDFLYSVHHLISLDNRIYKSPSGSSKSTSVSSNDCLNLMDIQGDWIKVRHDLSKCNDPRVNSSGPAGFIRWKKAGKVLINFRM
ncbi:hypothetical protein [Roseivirga sp. E12]|uniref:hypothetical protein n=1 Tax=Roseivirga sp. E12 TaxID=2819237 RepID=UPI001ABD0131|nr:hypothetical protein [Roseivirga sp. E12]MBO3700094.1 hypothetical protein [Roseivirga sp. E12]